MFGKKLMLLTTLTAVSGITFGIYKYLTLKSGPYQPVKNITDNSYFRRKLKDKKPEQIKAFQSFFEVDVKDLRQGKSFVDI